MVHSSGERKRKRLNSRAAKDTKTWKWREKRYWVLSRRCDHIHFSRVRLGHPIRLPSRTAVAFVFVCKSTFLLHEKLKTSRPASGPLSFRLHPLHTDGRTFFIRLFRPFSSPPPPVPSTARLVWSINTRQTHTHTAEKRRVGTTTSWPLFAIYRPPTIFPTTLRRTPPLPLSLRLVR